MPKKKRLRAEQIVKDLREVVVLQSQGKSIAGACSSRGTGVGFLPPPRGGGGLRANAS